MAGARKRHQKKKQESEASSEASSSQPASQSTSGSQDVPGSPPSPASSGDSSSPAPKPKVSRPSTSPIAGMQTALEQMELSNPSSSAATRRGHHSKSKPVTLAPMVESVDGRFKNLPRNPKSPGTLGTAVKVVTNHFKLNIDDAVAYHYDVVINRKKAGNPKLDKPKKGKGGDEPFVEIKKPEDLKRIFIEFEKELRLAGGLFANIRLAFDGRNLWTYGNQLNFQDCNQVTFESTFVFDGVSDVYVMKITYTGHVVNITQRGAMSEDALQALEIALNYHASKNMLTRGKGPKKDIFHPNKDLITILTSNLNLHTGIRKSVRRTEMGYTVNIDQAAAIFQKGGNLVDVVKRILGRDINMNFFKCDDGLADKLTRELKGLRITAVQGAGKYTRKFTIGRITSEDVTCCRFQIDDNGQNKEISVEEYFRTTRNPKKNLRKNLPCVRLQNGNYIPIEECTLIPHQYYTKKLDPKHQGIVTTMTATEPTLRMKTILEGANIINESAQHCLPIKMSLQPIVANARTLETPPMLVVKRSGQKGVEKPSLVPKSKWANPGDFSIEKLTLPKALNRWSVVAIHSGRNPLPNANEFLTHIMSKLRDQGEEMGMTVSPPIEIPSNYKFIPFDGTDGGRNGRDEVMKKLEFVARNLKSKGKLDLLIVCICQSDSLYYGIKTFGNDCEVLTQCLQIDVSTNRDLDERSFKKVTGLTFLKNMIFKINAKLGGENWRIDVDKLIKDKTDFIRQPGLMVMGIDITHPGIGDELKHSIAGFVGSYNKDLTCYMCQARSQKTARQEVIIETINSVKEVSKEFFNRYREKNQKYPSTLVVYRDGVSEGQFVPVVANEVSQLQEAMKDLGMNCKIIFLAAQKRHNTRFVLQAANNTYQNVKPGTVVDSFIVHPDRFEYYLNSHHALKGTSRSTHYCVLYDDTKGISRDQLHSMTYYLAYVYARCSKPISIAAPVMYAHLVCERAAGFVKTKYRTGQPEHVIDEYARVKDFQKNTLFYA